MLIANFHSLLWYERDPEVRALLQAAFDTEVIRADNVRAVIVQSNAWYNFMWAAHKHLGPGSDGPAFDAVHDAICALKQFPASKHIPDLDPGQTYPHDCVSRHGGSMAADPIPLAERCPATFTWWRNPYSREACTLRTWSIRKPSDYLLPYWMGRHYGFIPEDL